MSYEAAVEIALVVLSRLAVNQEQQPLFGKAAFERHHQEIIFPAAFVDPIGEIAVEWHNFNRSYKDSKYSLIMEQSFSTVQLHTVGLLIIRDRRLLLAFSNNKQCFYLPGGKIDVGETPAEALCREIAEELNIRLTPADLEYYAHTTAPAYGEKEGVIMEQDCYFVRRPVEPVASAEIGKIAWFTIDSYLLEPNHAPGAVMILEQLKREGFID